MSRMPVILRRPEPKENEAIQSLVQSVVDETYGSVWLAMRLTVDPQNWSNAWIALHHTEIIGVALTSCDQVDDLWIRRTHRGQGLGRRLLAAAEQEIAHRGFPTGRLRVISSNTTAIGFYRQSGWHPAREFPHESLPVQMVEMTKLLQTSQPSTPQQSK